MNFFKKIALLVFSTLAVCVTLLVAATYYYSDEVKTKIVEELKKYSANTILLGSIGDLTLFDHFPNMSVSLNNLVVLEQWDIPEKDHLLDVKKVDLKINVWALLSNSVQIDQIFISEGSIHLKKAKHGSYNYQSATKDSSTFDLSVKSVFMNSIDVQFIDLTTREIYAGEINTLKVKGDFNKPKVNFTLVGDIKLRLENEALAKKKTNNVKLDLDGTYNKATSKFKKVNASITVDNIDLEVIANTISSTNVDLNLKTSGIKVATINNILATDITESFKKINPSTQITAHSKISWEKDKAVKIDLDGEITNFQSIISEGIEVKNGTTKFTFSNQGSTSIKDYSFNVSDLYAQLNEEEIYLKGGLKNFKEPIIHFDLKKSFNATVLNFLLKDEKLSITSGNIKPNATLIIKTKNTDSLIFKDINIAGDLEVDDLDMTYSDGKNIHVNHLSAHFSENKIDVKDGSGSWNSTDFDLFGFIISPFKADRFLDFTVNLKELNTKNFASEQSNNSNSDSKKVEPIQLPQGKVNLKIGKFIDHALSLNNINADVRFNKNKIYLKRGSLEAFKGKGTFELVITSTEKVNVVGDASFNEIDIKSLFINFNEFNQEEITSKHISGQAHLESNFNFDLVNEQLDYSSIDVSSSITIENGELYEVPQLLSLVDYIKNKKLYAAVIDYQKLQTNVKRISFKTLKNKVIIKDELIVIPEMDVQSSALNLIMTGTHSFSNNIDYRFNFFLSDLLKKKDAKTVDGEWEIYDDPKKKWFNVSIGVLGNINNPEIVWHKKQTLERVKADLKKQPQLIKNLLKEGFSKDGNKVIEENKPEMEFYHPDYSPAPQNENSNSPKSQKKKKRSLFNLESNEAEQEEVDIDNL